MQRRRQTRRHIDETLRIPAKANRILNVVLIGMILILLRVWHLSVVQYDEKLDESRRPQRRIVLEAPKRATIRDRFNVPLAINKLQYSVSILYANIRQIPTSSWDFDSDGKRVKRAMRREYIESLSEMLAKELDMDADRIEDLIHAKAALYDQIPFVLKENITEKQYYRLKMLEKDWAGLQAQRVPYRHYTKGKVAADIIGYMGAINNNEYDGIIREMKALEAYVKAVDEGDVPPLPEGVETPDAVWRRLKDLQELAYGVNDSIGKTGIEGRYEKTLRGYRGKRSYYSDARGNFLRELPGTREPLSGKRVMLTLSSELQEYAENLLIENEKIRQPCLARLGPVKRTVPADKAPWIKGGAIVAMDPNTGEILAMASHPRFDPNDFIASGDPEERNIKKHNIFKWLESEVYLGEIWDGKRKFDRELFSKSKGIYLEEVPLTWNAYLDYILSKESPLRESVVVNGTVWDAVRLQNSVGAVLKEASPATAYELFNVMYRGGEHQPHGKKLSAERVETIESALAALPEGMRNEMDTLRAFFDPLSSSYDKVMLVDLMRVAVHGGRFSHELLTAVGSQSLKDYKEYGAAFAAIYEEVRKMSRDLYHDIDFKEWRKGNEKAYLKGKREEEKQSRRYAKPYIDYLDHLEKERFAEFWQKHSWNFILAFVTGVEPYDASGTASSYYSHLTGWHREIAGGAHHRADWASSYRTLQKAIKGLSPALAVNYMQTFRSYDQLDRPLLGSYRAVRKSSAEGQLEKNLAAAFYPKYGYGYGRSQAYRQAATQGSIFKLITAYEALVQRYDTLKQGGGSFDLINPLKIEDRVKRSGKYMTVGSLENGTPITRHYKGGRMPRSINANIGMIDIVKAIEMSSNPYFSLLAGDVIKSPDDLANAARKFSFGSKTGIDLPGEISGGIPDDLATNRTGLYSFAIGQHTLVVTPLQTGVMLSTLVNGGKVLKPKLVQMFVGKEPRRGKELVAGNYYFPYQESLSDVGIDFPLFISADADRQKSLISKVPTEVKRNIFLPHEIQKVLLDGMCRVVSRTQGESLSSLSRLYKSCPEAITDYQELKAQLVGKTSTAESVEHIDLDFDKGANMYTHVWFGGISYDRDVNDQHEHKFIFNDPQGKPELVVVVYLRYGGYGKEAAPVAAQVAKKWKEIKKRYEQEEPL